MIFKVLIFVGLFSALLGKEISKADITGKKILSANEETQNWIHTWEAPDIIRKNFLYYVSGYDEEDRPILVLPWGRWDFRSIVEKGGENVRSLSKHTDQLVQRILQGTFLEKSNDTNNGLPANDEIVVIVDFDDLNLRQLTHAENFKFLVENVAKINLCYQKIAYGFVINVNSVGQQILQIFKPTLSSFLERFDIYGTRPELWRPKLLRRIPRDQLEPAYGGPKDFRPVQVFG